MIDYENGITMLNHGSTSYLTGPDSISFDDVYIVIGRSPNTANAVLLDGDKLRIL